jgi:hypothetical protein
MNARDKYQRELLAEAERIRLAAEQLADRLDAYARDLLAEQLRRAHERTRNE